MSARLCLCCFQDDSGGLRVLWVSSSCWRAYARQLSPYVLTAGLQTPPLSSLSHLTRVFAFTCNGPTSTSFLLLIMLPPSPRIGTGRLPTCCLVGVSRARDVRCASETAAWRPRRRGRRGRGTGWTVRRRRGGGRGRSASCIVRALALYNSRALSGGRGHDNLDGLAEKLAQGPRSLYVRCNPPASAGHVWAASICL